MGAAPILLTLSALVGFGLGRFSWLAIATASVMLALLSAFVLQMQAFSTPSGIAIIVVCLTVSQAAYLMRVIFGDQLVRRSIQKQAKEDLGQSSLSKRQPSDL
jgi:hypothetical protein